MVSTHTLNQRQAELAASIAADQARLLRLTALHQTLDQGGFDPLPVVMREVPSIEVYSVRKRVPQLGVRPCWRRWEKTGVSQRVIRIRFR
jgi:hypothetical protein